MSEYRLEMCDVVKTFPGVKALNHAQLKLKPGTVHALMGENGAGKSTLMKCMFGIYLFDEVKIDKKFLSDKLTENGKIVLQEIFHLLKIGRASCRERV